MKSKSNPTPAKIAYWSKLTHPLFQNRPLYVAATEQGLSRITWPNETFELLQAWADKHGMLLEENDEHVSDYTQQLRQYLDGERNSFDLPLDPQGTDFQKEVWKALTGIPYGQTNSYSDIAASIGRPAAVRAVGAANGANPIPIVVPCHRVIGKNSALTGFAGGLKVKEDLLKLEGYHDYKTSGHARFQF
ncbi:methylated-DNA--[protein]-cysteine S-methyltransferase [Paenibacillus koleovorans]|uniref:methylated-DNA--[protein]-cysteine S-methyltransferase n=1 Tax=Paenibacillus koleovorans TaxID=121608 RepID=UPI000FD83350|nr:methylated-DNA--[protein]-cysteine S-methyltransferase [Paenibacillus koleovorans]